MGNAGELCAMKYKSTRQELDDFALESYRRAREAIASGAFKREIVGVEVPQKKGPPIVVTEDEEPNRVDLSKMRSLKPVFQEDGLLTVGNSPSCSDGAEALVVGSEQEAERLGLKPMARIVDYAGAALAPEWFTIAPVEAIKRVLKLTGLSIKDIDLFEINEAFSAVSLAINRELGLDPVKVNVNGGAVALGHPIGATGARILTTLLYAMETRGARRGMAMRCRSSAKLSRRTPRSNATSSGNWACCASQRPCWRATRPPSRSRSLAPPLAAPRRCSACIS